MAEGSIRKSFLAERVSDAARLVERAAKFRQGQRIAAQREVPNNRHGIAVLVVVADAPSTGTTTASASSSPYDAAHLQCVQSGKPHAFGNDRL